MAENNQIALTDKQKEALTHFGRQNDHEQVTVERDAEEEQIADPIDTKVTPTITIEATTIPATEINDEIILAHLKANGINISSLTDLTPKPTPEEEKRVAEQSEAEKLSFGLKKGLFNKNQYESFITDRKDRVGLVFNAELQDAKEADVEWNEEKEAEFKSEFEEKYGVSLDPSSPKYKRGQKQIAVISDAILKSTYNNIYALDTEYGKYESERKLQLEKEAKILQEAPVYKKDVTDVINSFVTFPVPLGTESFEVPVSKEMREKMENLLLDQNFAQSQILNGHKKENLVEIAKTLLVQQGFSELAFEAAKLYRAKHEKGLRGIPPVGPLDKEVSDEKLTDKQKEALSHFKGHPTLIAN